MPKPKKVFGYEIRDPFPNEKTYFEANKHVAGMAASDGRIVLNPFSGLSNDQQHQVAMNEATRLFLRSSPFVPNFQVTPEQQRIFASGPYGAPDATRALHDTIIARIVSGDPSVGTATPEQSEWARRIRMLMEYNANNP